MGSARTISAEPRTVLREGEPLKPGAGGEGASFLLPEDSSSLLVLYATATGTAESLANRLADDIRAAGMAAYVRDMAQCRPDVLKQTGCVLVVVSTYGNGEPPESAATFYEALVHGDGLDLKGLRFSVLALGNTTFDYFCRCGREVDAALERHGATRMYPRADCDVDYEVPARQWLKGILAVLLNKHRTAV